MSERSLRQEEIVALEKQLGEAKERLRSIALYVEDLEGQVQKGATWQYEPEEFRKMCVKVEASCKKWQEESEITKYGHVLTATEREKEDNKRGLEFDYRTD